MTTITEYMPSEAQVLGYFRPSGLLSSRSTACASVGVLSSSPMANWQSFDFDTFNEFPQQPGVYAIYLNGQLSYIGSSIDVAGRLDDHGINWARYSNTLETPWGRGFRKCVIKVRRSRRFGDWAMHEMRLIRRLRPRFNKRGVKGVAR